MKKLIIIMKVHHRGTNNDNNNNHKTQDDNDATQCATSGYDTSLSSFGLMFNFELWSPGFRLLGLSITMLSLLFAYWVSL